MAALRIALLNFVAGGSIRRLQQATADKKREKYAFMVHTESARRSHSWQERIVRQLLGDLVRIVKDEPFVLEGLVKESYEDLERSLNAGGDPFPDFEATLIAVRSALAGDEIMVSIVNSESQVKDQLDDEGQLRLDAPLNIFIGGQILDRGITIRNLIGFYYGRNPQNFQQDTVLQHARLYGNRPKADLWVTRFYTTDGIHQVMKRIHEFDTALRSDLEKGDKGEGIYFLRKDDEGEIIPCSPNKILASDIVTIRPHKRLLPVGFQTGYKSYISKHVSELDEMIHKLQDTDRPEDPVLIRMEDAGTIMRMIEKTLDFEDDDYQWDFDGHIAALKYLSNKAEDAARRGQVWLFVREGRNLARLREGEQRFSNEPLSYQERPIVNNIATDLPVLSLVRQEGTEAQGWRGTPFWWPIITPPAKTKTTIFASKTRGED